jgi:hypothetical protein
MHLLHAAARCPWSSDYHAPAQLSYTACIKHTAWRLIPSSGFATVSQAAVGLLLCPDSDVSHPSLALQNTVPAAGAALHSGMAGPQLPPSIVVARFITAAAAAAAAAAHSGGAPSKRTRSLRKSSGMAAVLATMFSGGLLGAQG